MVTVEIARQPTIEAVPAHSSESNILLVPGLPDYHAPERDQALYPPSATDLIKLARQKGVSIGYADDGNRAFVGLKAAEIWMPIVVFLSDAMAAGFGVVIGDWLRELLGAERDGHVRLHVKVGKQDSDGSSVEWMTAHGDAGDVLDALDRFLNRSDESSDERPNGA